MQITWRYASGGVLIRRTYVGSEAMPTFKLPHYRWEKHIAIWICYMPFINDCVCQVVSAGICLVALAVTRLSETKPTEHLAVSQSDGGGGMDHKVNDTWAGAHLVSVVNLLPGQHVVFIGATCCRVDPSVSGAKAGAANPPPRIWRPAQQSPLDPISALIVVFLPPLLFGSVADLASLKVAVMSSASNML